MYNNYVNFAIVFIQEVKALYSLCLPRFEMYAWTYLDHFYPQANLLLLLVIIFPQQEHVKYSGNVNPFHHGKANLGLSL